jgi:hypothetical protein
MVAGNRIEVSSDEFEKARLEGVRHRQRIEATAPVQQERLVKEYAAPTASVVADRARTGTTLSADERDRWLEAEVNALRARRDPMDTAPLPGTRTDDGKVILQATDGEGDCPPRPTAWPDGMRVGRHDVLSRMPGMEALAANVFEVPVRAVWRIVHFHESGRSVLGGFAMRSRRGLVHVSINVAAHPACPVRLAHTLRHELAHVERGDLDSRPALAIDQHAEDACNAAANQALVRQVLPLVEMKTGTQVDADVCLECCREWRTSCGQGADVFAAVTKALQVYSK